MIKYKREGVKLKANRNIYGEWCAKGSRVWTIMIDGEEALHREDGPALVNEDKDKRACYYHYCINGKLHNTKGPAILLVLDGQIVEKEYFINGKKHRENGPAEVKFSMLGRVSVECYYLDDVYLFSASTFDEITNQEKEDKFKAFLKEYRAKQMYE